MITATYLGSDITLSSPYLDDTSNIDELQLTSKINCCSTQYISEILVGDVAAGAFTIDGLDFYNVDNLADGIYSFSLKITYDDGSVRIERGCLFVDNTTSCAVAEYVQENRNLEIQMDLFILKQAGTCGCECDTFCDILERLWKDLGLIDCDICSTSVNCESC